jgi:hypothetical protein
VHADLPQKEAVSVPPFFMKCGLLTVAICLLLLLAFGEAHGQ